MSNPYPDYKRNTIAVPARKRPQNCGTGYCSCIECVMEPAQQQELKICNCRWDGDAQVQQCTLHQAHVDAIHEWAERAKTAEAKLKEQPDYKALYEKAVQQYNELAELMADQPAQQEPVAWFKHGPYEDGELLSVVFEDPNDDVCYSPLGFIDSSPQPAQKQEPDELRHIGEQDWLLDVDEKAWRSLVENRGGCRCHISPPCDACSNPISEVEMNEVGYTYTSPPTLSLAQRQARSADTWVNATTWRGLTLEDMETTPWSPDFRAGAKWAAAKLKEQK
jgi:hypothetical protein